MDTYKKTYTEETNCGTLNLEVSELEGDYSFRASMEKFGDCQAYKFISELIEAKLNDSSFFDAWTFAREELFGYMCTKEGGEITRGCITAMGACLDKFMQEVNTRNIEEIARKTREE